MDVAQDVECFSRKLLRRYFHIWRKELSNDSTIELSRVKQVHIIDEVLNLLIEEAFERIKTYYGSNKKLAAEELVKKISSDLDYEFIKNEFKELTRIGNNYNIRHYEIGKELIKKERHIEYLFFRMLTLLNFYTANIQSQNELII